jgi:hypothetical protein
VEPYAVVDYLSADRLESDGLDEANDDALIVLRIGCSGADGRSNVDQRQKGDDDFRRNGEFDIARQSIDRG